MPLFNLTKGDENNEKKSSILSFFKRKKDDTVPMASKNEGHAELEEKFQDEKAQEDSDNLVIEKVEDQKKDSILPITLSQPKEKESGSILDSIVSHAQSKGVRNSILGPKPTHKESPTVQYGVEKNLRTMQLFFKLTLLLFVLTSIFFFVELNPNIPYLEEVLGYQSTAKRNTNLSKNLKELQTITNYNHFLIANFSISDLIQQTDLYNDRLSLMRSRKASSGASDPTLTREAETLLKNIQSLLAVIYDQLKSPLYPESVDNPYIQISEKDPEYISAKNVAELTWNDEYANLLTQFIENKKTELKDRYGLSEAKPQLEILNRLPALVQKKNFIRNAIPQDSLETLDHLLLNEIIGKIRSVSKDALSIIAQIKEHRINWTENLKLIEDLTRQVDPLFGRTGVEDIARIVYTSYAFDASKNTISIQADIRSDDSKVFSEVLKLVEVFQNSANFSLQNEVRKFSKALKNGRYASALSLVLQIKNPEEEKEETQEGSETLAETS